MKKIHLISLVSLFLFLACTTVVAITDRMKKHRDISRIILQKTYRKRTLSPSPLFPKSLYTAHLTQAAYA